MSFSGSPHYLVLSNPCVLEGKWKAAWFDSAHQHFILLKTVGTLATDSNVSIDCADFYTWSFAKYSNPQPVLLYKDKLEKKRPSILIAKLSLDCKLLLIQTSLTTVTVVDIEFHKKWTITIKNPDENRILPSGLCWSEHGGGSQDLIIVTLKGLELYKVSASRGQCKLSRAITQSCYAFWYEPNHRMMLIASTSSTFMQPKPHDGTYIMHGIFFRSDKSTSLKLELPPPEKSPK